MHRCHSIWPAVGRVGHWMETSRARASLVGLMNCGPDLYAQFGLYCHFNQWQLIANISLHVLCLFSNRVSLSWENIHKSMKYSFLRFVYVKGGRGEREEEAQRCVMHWFTPHLARAPSQAPGTPSGSAPCRAGSIWPCLPGLIGRKAHGKESSWDSEASQGMASPDMPQTSSSIKVYFLR